MTVTVSVVIPSYNHGRYIDAAVRSVLSQTLEDLELIVIDDGSTDDTLVRLAKINDERLSVIAQANAGAHATINRGLKMASGKFLTVLNSDDEYASDRLDLIVAALNRVENAKMGFAVSWIEVIDASGKAVGIKRGWENMLPWEVPASIPEATGFSKFTMQLLASNFVSTTSNIVMRRELFKEVGDFSNLRFAHDWDFLLRAARLSEGLLIPKALIRYRIHPSNTIRQDRAGMMFEICWVLATHAPEFLAMKKRDGTNEQQKAFCEWLNGAIHTFGQDRIFFILAMAIGSGRSKGESIAGEALLELDNPIRSWCLEKIRENEPVVS